MAIHLLEGIFLDPLILSWGFGCLLVQGTAYVLLRYIVPGASDAPWKTELFFTSKMIVTFSVMVYTTVLGTWAWFFHGDYAAGGVCAVDMIHGQSWIGIYLSKIMVGLLSIWDVPTEFLHGCDKVDLLMLAHHIGMFAVATIGLGFYWDNDDDDEGDSSSVILGSCYAPFIFGVIEVSSIPLSIVNFFHPKQKAWHDWHLSRPWAVTLNLVSRISFGLLFLLVRVLYFPYVILGSTIPDLYGAIQDTDDTAGVVSLVCLAVFCVLFTALQWHWGFLVIRQLIKMARGTPSSPSKPHKREKGEYEAIA